MNAAYVNLGHWIATFKGPDTIYTIDNDVVMKANCERLHSRSQYWLPQDYPDGEPDNEDEDKGRSFDLHPHISLMHVR